MEKTFEKLCQNDLQQFNFPLYTAQVKPIETQMVYHSFFALPSVPGGGGGGALPRIWVGVCSCGSEGKLLVKSRLLFRANFWWKVDPYLGQTFGEKYTLI